MHETETLERAKAARRGAVHRETMATTEQEAAGWLARTMLVAVTIVQQQQQVLLRLPVAGHGRYGVRARARG